MSNREQFINGLRELADFLEAKPEIPVDNMLGASGIYLPMNNIEEMAAMVKLVGNTEKQSSSDYYRHVRYFGPHKIIVYADHKNVCTRKVTGTRQVAEIVIPAEPEKIIPAHVEEIVEWECPPSIFAAASPLAVVPGNVPVDEQELGDLSRPDRFEME